ncbi:MAG TPA: thiamine pyrophosphate-dependent enzyme [Syntrophales bacterium]|nr:thiamine pyrophosphate-dependent enzyme [Syntrophales bacterium]HOX93626.1 thiamine pyrophosphate-dependent enzyme [Syntrophales bacterium]HPI57823.1 thiamine pyrophosphate-dependent enzyme [Syntrophales bacterium]HPN25537.1 thiamine pyrophosphate-dependent enzyme [Syntrophales bacterium]HQM28483.1 thiamine pyrophosphate-dependent enzyme [Syntrophales bacterium]
MSFLIDEGKDIQHVLMGNEAIVRGALEAGVNVATGYPGTPSSEVIEAFSKVARERNVYVEWSTNEKVATEVAAAASFAGLRSICVMKQNGVNVASDFLLHLASSGTRGGMLLVTCDDPGALSSVNEGESRLFARLLEMPLVEPGDFQETKDIIPWAFDLSEKIGIVFMLRSVTRLSHASGNVRFAPLPGRAARAKFAYHGPLLDQDTGPVISMIPARPEAHHGRQQEKLKRAEEIFETCRFNTYTGPPEPELLIITSSICSLYSREAVDVLGLGPRVGVLKLATTWPLPRKLLTKHLASTKKVFFVEEVAPTLEDHVKVIAAEAMSEIGVTTFYGKKSGHLPAVGELNPDLVISALSRLCDVPYHSVPQAFKQKLKGLAERYAPVRGIMFCPGCPHRASFWSINNALQMDNRSGFVCGDIGCYALAAFPTGFSTNKTLHSMGSGSGLASGFGKLRQFGMDQPVVAVCGDSTFFHAAMPALANAIHHRSPFTLVLLDNRGTAMTGFQPHPGSPTDVLGDPAPALDMEKICMAMGAKVEVSDPFDLEKTRKKLNRLLESTEGAKVLILRQACALSPERRSKKKYEVTVDEDRCRGENCGCNRICTRIFGCPGLIWDREKKVSRIDDIICTACGVCADICPAGAIVRKEVR